MKYLYEFCTQRHTRVRQRTKDNVKVKAEEVNEEAWSGLFSAICVSFFIFVSAFHLPVSRVASPSMLPTRGRLSGSLSLPISSHFIWSPLSLSACISRLAYNICLPVSDIFSFILVHSFVPSQEHSSPVWTLFLSHSPPTLGTFLIRLEVEKIFDPENEHGTRL